MDIPISKEGGLEPHLTVCEQCGEDTEDITIGVLKKAQDNDGVWHYIPRGHSSKFNNERRKQGLNSLSNWEKVQEREKVPLGLCEKCKKEQEQYIAIVKKGGIFFRCLECNCSGVIKAGVDLAEDVRKTLNITAPDVCGIEFVNCKEHTMAEEEK